ncbi:MAG: PD-(D/E)XK nuclease family protein [Elusimicrobiota bacterium]
MKLPQPKYAVADVDHKYSIALPDGETIGPLVSVTKVLDVRAKPALIAWSAREAANYFKTEILRVGAPALDVSMLELIAKDAAQAHRRKAKDAADLGSAAHNAFEAIILGRDPESPPKELIEPISAFKAYRLQSDIEVVATEVAVASVKHKFGGRLDFLGYSKKRGGWGIGDLKTSSGFFGSEYALQVGGYAAAVEEMFGLNIAWSEIIRFSKKPPYESEARPVTDMAAAISGFLEALAMVRRDETPLIGKPTFQSAGIAPSADVAVKAKKAAKPLGLGF